MCRCSVFSVHVSPAYSTTANPDLSVKTIPGLKSHQNLIIWSLCLSNHICTSQLGPECIKKQETSMGKVSEAEICRC